MTWQLASSILLLTQAMDEVSGPMKEQRSTVLAVF